MKLKIQYLSDLHLEFNSDLTLPKTGDILILAGDICPVANTQLFEAFLNKVCGDYRLVLFVPGNHEYYGANIEQVNSFLETITIPNFKYLNNACYQYFDICFIGSTLWSHIPPEAEDTVLKEINDYRSIRDFTIERGNALHQASIDYVRKQLDRCAEHGLQSVVITHHAPLSAGTSHPRHNGNVRNAAFATNLPKLVSRADWWICGHTHYCNKISIGRCTLLLNCKGYNRGGRGYDPGAHITLEYGNDY